MPFKTRLILSLFMTLTVGLNFLMAQGDTDTLQRFSNNTMDAEHHQYSSTNPSACNYGFIFGHSCQEYREFAEKFTLTDTTVIEGLFAYIAAPDQEEIVSTDSSAFTIYRDSSNYPGQMLTRKKVNFQDLKVNSVFDINSRSFNNFTLATFSDSVVLFPDSSFFASFGFPKYRNNFNATGTDHQDTLTLRTSENDTTIDVRNVVRQKDGRWLETEMFTNKSVYLYLAPVVKTDFSKTSDSSDPDTMESKTDTLRHFTDENDSVKHFRYQGSQGNCDYGYLFGHSCEEFQGFAEKFTFKDSVHIEGLLAYVVSEDDSIKSTDSANFSLYKNANDTPAQSLTREKMAIQDLTINDTSSIHTNNFKNFTYADFTDTTIVENNASVFTSFELPTYQNNFSGNNHPDTLALRTSTNKQGQKYAKAVQSNDGSWAKIENATKKGSEINFFLAPVINTEIPETSDTSDDGGTDSREPLIKRGGLGLIKSYPNPAGPKFNVQFSLDRPMTVNIHIFSTDGRHVKESRLGQLKEGTHEANLNVSDLKQGQYIYTLETSHGVLSGKLNKH